jgi:signal transduction histidine kinase
MQPTLEKADLLMLTKNVCDAYRLASANKSITIEFKANTPEVVCVADSRFITQIADNLISNALKYSPSQTTITVRTLHIIPDDTNANIKFHPTILHEFGIREQYRIRVPSAVLLVRDQGPGISDDDKEKLFQKFARLSAQPTGGEHSTGLGLSIVKRLAESMNAEVWCESVLGEGATFAVAFPLAQPVPEML